MITSLSLFTFHFHFTKTVKLCPSFLYFGLTYNFICYYREKKEPYPFVITKKYKTEQCKFYIYENCRQLYKNEGVFFFPLFDLISLLLLSYTALYFTMCIFNIYIKMSFLWQVLGTRRDHVHFQYIQKCPFYGKFWGLEGNGAGA